MTSHQFIFSPGDWIGQGRITFSHSPGHIRFYTKWIINKEQKGIIRAEQQIEQEGESVLLFNTLQFSAITAKSFEVLLSNDLTGKVSGKGVIEPNTIAWEFRKPNETGKEEQVEGFEVYEIQENGDYMLHAEYFSSGQYRTIIDGRIWQKNKK